jgi:hypothetical protein
MIHLITVSSSATGCHTRNQRQRSSVAVIGLGSLTVTFPWPRDDTEPPTAEYYRDKAEEIRHVARRARNPEIARELLELALRFDLMAAYADKRKLSEAAV